MIPTDKDAIDVVINSIKNCNYTPSLVTVFLPTYEDYMCESIRLYYSKKYLINMGFTKERAEEILNNQN